MQFKVFLDALFRITHPDATMRRRGITIVGISVFLVFWVVLIGLLSLVAVEWRETAILICPFGIIGLIAIRFAQRGATNYGAGVVIASILIALVTAPIIANRVAFTPFFFLLPLLMALVTLTPRGFLIASGAIFVALILLALVSSTIPPTMPPTRDLYGVASMLLLMISGIGYIGSRTTHHAIQALHEAQSQSQTLTIALQAERDHLSARVDERTQELSQSLAHSHHLIDQQTLLLRENDRQRATIRSLSVPILPLHHQMLLVPLIGTIDHERVHEIQHHLLATVDIHRAKIVLLDLTGVAIIDHAGIAMVQRIVQASGLLGAQVAFIGIRPETAQSLVNLGNELAMVTVFRDLHAALQYHRSLLFG